MTSPDPQPSRLESSTLGAILGLSGGPAAGYGAVWSGIGDASWGTALLATLVSALIGGATWGLFRQPTEGVGVGFAALFGGVVGLLAGATVAFPVGGLCGAVGGVGGGLVAAATWRSMDPDNGALRAAVAGASGALSGWALALVVVV